MNNNAGSEHDSARLTILTTAYGAAVQHWVHAEETRWTLLYNYFMGSSICFWRGPQSSPLALRAEGFCWWF
jgi:hypothetical protein